MSKVISEIIQNAVLIQAKIHLTISYETQYTPKTC